MNQEIILSDSDLAARYVTNIKGWVSRKNLFFGDGDAAEAAARYDGCTHVRCRECGEPAPRGWVLCDSCRDKSEAKRYASMPRAPWDGKAMLYSQVADEYYSSPDEAEDALEDGQTLGDLRLVICEPNYVYLRPDYFDRVVPDEGELPEEVLKAIEAFNASVRNVIVSWSPGNAALLIDEPASIEETNKHDHD